MSSLRQYDLVVLGATGYTGKLAAEYIINNLPADFRWAIAGRSLNKLESVSEECKALNPQGSHPGKFWLSHIAYTNYPIINKKLMFTHVWLLWELLQLTDLLAIEVCSLDTNELDALAKKTTVLITTIGPYSHHGEPAFKACADNGTHYLDITGEAVWHNQMIKKYERTAKTTGSIMIPQIGVDSAPADIMTWLLVRMIREKFSVPTAEVVLSANFA